VAAVVDILGRGLPHALEAVAAPEAAHVDVCADDLGLVWRVERRDGRWWFGGHRPAASDGGDAPDAPFAVVSGTGDAYWRRWSRHPVGGRGAFSTAGDAAAAAAVVDHVAIIRGPD